MDMNDTTFQTTEYAINNMEFQIPEWNRCSFISDHLIMFLFGGIGMSLVSLIGMIGNVLCAIVLSRPPMRTSTNIILLGLSVFDFMAVFFGLLMFGIPLSIQYFCVESYELFYLTTLYPVMITYFQPLSYIAQLGSTYFTLLVTVERFFVVYHPLMARPYCTNTNAIRTSLVIASTMILYTMPYWWHFKIESVYDENGSWTKYRIFLSLFANANYRLYNTWSYMFVYRIIPVTLLTALNISIYWKIRKANKMRESMTHVNSTEISVAKMLIWVVSIFLLCNSVNVYHLLRVLVDSKFSSSPEFITVIFFFFDLNSAVNFFIYSFKTKKFRLVFLELFWPKELRGRSINNGPRITERAGSGTTGTQLSLANAATNV